MNDSDGSGGLAFALFIAGPATGFAIWAWIHARYRNKGARYRPDQVVAHTVARLDQNDAFVKRTVSKSSSLSGRNEGSHDQRAARVEVIEQ
jgi:hypothetical protein